MVTSVARRALPNKSAPARPQSTQPRRTQEQRTADMRRRLCEATLDSLCDVGYERLSTDMIAKRAGVSRGAQTHHFPTKVDLLVGAFEHQLELWEASRRDFVASHAHPIPFDIYLRYLWTQVISQPRYVASIELMLAARGDAILRRRLQKVLDRWAALRDAVWLQTVALPADETRKKTFLQINLCLLRGMAIHASFNRDPGVNADILDAWIDLVGAKRKPARRANSRASAPRG